MKCYRRVLKISLTDMKTTNEILAELNIIDKWLLKSIQQRKLIYFGLIKHHNSIEKTILEGHMSGCLSRGRPRRKWTQDIKDCLHMTAAGAGHLAGDQHCFGMTVIKAMSNDG